MAGYLDSYRLYHRRDRVILRLFHLISAGFMFRLAIAMVGIGSRIISGIPDWYRQLTMGEFILAK